MTTLEKVQNRADSHTSKLMRFREELSNTPKTSGRYFQLAAYIQVLTAEIDFLNGLSFDLSEASDNYEVDDEEEDFN